MILKVGNQEIEYDSEDNLIEAIQQYHYDNLTHIEYDDDCKTASVFLRAEELGNKANEVWHFWIINIGEEEPLISRICSTGIMRRGAPNPYKWEKAAEKLGVPIDRIKKLDSEWGGEEYPGE